MCTCDDIANGTYSLDLIACDVKDVASQPVNSYTEDSVLSFLFVHLIDSDIT